MTPRETTDTELAALCDEFCALLRLRDWVIGVSFVAREKIEDNLGECHLVPGRRMAKIQLCDSLRTDYPELVDTLFHELLHCYFAPETRHRSNIEVEAGVDGIAGALAALYLKSKTARADV